MKRLYGTLALLVWMAVTPEVLQAEPPTEPMASATFKIQGIFASTLGDGVNNRMTGSRVYVDEGSIDGIGVMNQFIERMYVTVRVSGMDDMHVSVINGFAGFPGFFPAVSATDVPYELYVKPSLSAPNVIYFPYNGKDNQIRYVLTGYTGTGGIASGLPSGGMTTTVTPDSPLTLASTITWNYRKQVRVSVATFGEDVPLVTYDAKGDTTAGSAIVTNLSSTAGLAPGMLVYGNGIPDGTTVTAVDAGNSSVTLSSAAARTFTQSSGQRLSFAPVPADSSADPRECPGSDAAACAANAGATKSGINFYDAADTSSVTLTARESFIDSVSGEERRLIQVFVDGGGTGEPVRLSLGGRKALTAIGMSTPMTVEWRYDSVLAFQVGKPLEPVAVPSGKTVDYGRQPKITILAADPSLPADNVDTAFVWAWDSSDPHMPSG